MGVLMSYFVYLLASETGVLYVGMTNNIKRRIYEHKCGKIEGFTAQYNVDRLVYFEQFGHVKSAIKREKQIKGWVREKKAKLIYSVNADWRDLAADWFS
jgi:putative endonuclease